MKNKDLNKIVKTFLNKDSSNQELFSASRDLGTFFENFSHLSTEDSHFEVGNDSVHSNLNSGVAISPLDAAICINEHMRTTKYMRGVYDAINDLLIKFSDEKIHLFYAGTGPYATLVIPLLHLFNSKRLEVTFLDIHQSSLDSVKNILNSLSLNEFIKDLVCEDATKYKFKSKVHLIITETMRAAFEGEPQVNITLNLLPQLCVRGEFLPQSVNIHLESSLRKSVQKGNNLVLTKESNFLADIIKLDSKKRWSKDNLIITPILEIKEDSKDDYELLLCTQIKVYKENILNENECSLNMPFPLFLTQKVLKGDVFEFYYNFENRPEILYKHQKGDKNIIDSYARCYPREISYRYKNTMIIWQEYLADRFLKPFFNEEKKSKNKRYLSWQELEEIADGSVSIEPTGFIFHSSRCDSSMLTDALSCIEKNIVIKEAKFIQDVLTLNYKEDISKEDIKKRLKIAIEIFTRKRFDVEENFFIKFNSWEISYIDIIKELYPNTPILILYASPKKILLSHQKNLGVQMVPRYLEGKVFDSIPSEVGFSDYPLAVLENIFEEILFKKDEQNIMFINHEDIKKLFFMQIAPFFKLTLDEKEKRIIIDSFTSYLKKQKENLDEEIYISDKLKDIFVKLENIKVNYA